MFKKFVCCLLMILLALAVPALAILGVGDVVYDPANFEEALQQLAQLEQQYLQLVQTYNMIRNQYAEMQRMAQQLPAAFAARYRSPVTAWALSSPTDAYGNAAGWKMGINTGLNAGAGYASATQSLPTYGAAWANIPAEEVDSIKANYATVELADGANVAALQTVGQIRGNAAGLDSAIQNLENDSLSSDPDLNTEMAVLNKINAAGVLALRNQQNTNQLLASLAESQVVEAKRARDAEAKAFTDHAQFMAQARDVMAAQAAGASAALTAWRLP